MAVSWQIALADYQQRINGLLTERLDALPDTAPRLKQAMQHALLLGGKRVRPALVYATGDMLGLTQADLDPPAMALECIHAYSLIHDDLPAMDDDDLRRGQPTCHVRFDEATAILAGDALQTLAFELLCHEPLSVSVESARLPLLQTLTGAAGYQGMCGGQAQDLAATNTPVTLEQLEQLHLAKTGALIRAALIMPAQLAELPEQQQASLNEFGRNIGLAFQVQDDILDITADTQILGKPQGSDDQGNKSTYPSLLGLQGAKNLCQQLHQQAVQALGALPYNTELLQSFSDFIINRDY
ncbi:Dimethylallyltranstransferase [Saliniradius amylolyticus]|uniref:Dimethylallyltranstransferase n=1 Tax=Saliniradius amylolyticus TaxID=2183582 RepID=A0A2S2E4K7_9ALTE|nr:farnesyl diphosphate synthase [Saliniradius amylolyticus]AWL12452.1 Dimethylallyltranstransferase [Saliniradius amylolyticus]